MRAIRRGHALTILIVIIVVLVIAFIPFEWLGKLNALLGGGLTR